MPVQNEQRPDKKHVIFFDRITLIRHKRRLKQNIKRVEANGFELFRNTARELNA